MSGEFVASGAGGNGGAAARVYDVMAPIAINSSPALANPAVTVQGAAASPAAAFFSTSDVGAVGGVTSDTNILNEVWAYRLIHPGSVNAGFRRLLQFTAPTPFLDKTFAPRVHRDIRGAFRVLYRMAWLTPRTLNDQTVNGLEFYVADVPGGNSPMNGIGTTGPGFALQQRNSGLYFISCRANGGALLVNELVQASIVDRRWYDLEFRIESARRDIPARLSVLIDGAIVWDDDWDSGFLPVPTDEASNAQWRGGFAMGPPVAAGVDDVASRIYVASARLMAGASLANLL